jgi:hypothetical protein
MRSTEHKHKNFLNVAERDNIIFLLSLPIGNLSKLNWQSKYFWANGKNKFSIAWWHSTDIPATQDADAEDQEFEASPSKVRETLSQK